MAAPIGLILFGAGAPLPFIWSDLGVASVRPETIQYTRTSRGTITHTAGAAFLDDFGEGVGQLVLEGTTGWKQGLPGEVKFKLLEGIFVEYLRRRKALAEANQDPDQVQLWYTDALNLEALSVYPHEFVLNRTKARPHLLYYRMRFSVLADLAQQAVLGGRDFLQSSLSGVASAVGGLFA